jgi:hypothetical protein
LAIPNIQIGLEPMQTIQLPSQKLFLRSLSILHSCQVEQAIFKLGPCLNVWKALFIVPDITAFISILFRVQSEISISAMDRVAVSCARSAFVLINAISIFICIPWLVCAFTHKIFGIIQSKFIGRHFQEKEIVMFRQTCVHVQESHDWFLLKRVLRNSLNILQISNHKMHKFLFHRTTVVGLDAKSQGLLKRRKLHSAAQALKWMKCIEDLSLDRW